MEKQVDEGIMQAMRKSKELRVSLLLNVCLLTTFVMITHHCIVVYPSYRRAHSSAMERLLLQMLNDSSTSSPSHLCVGLGGIPDSTGLFCCNSSCGSCGGTGCGGRHGGADACCEDNLEAANVACGDPPCLMESHAQAQLRDAEVYSAKCKDAGGIPDLSGMKCCAASCGVCGGEGCASRPGGADLCCGDNLATANETCGVPACIFQPNPREAEARAQACDLLGGVSDATGLACCAAMCGTCGGVGCESQPGGAGNCCLDRINEVNQLCGDPPCLLLALSESGHGNSSEEWWRFGSGDIVSRAAAHAPLVKTSEGSNGVGLGGFSTGMFSLQMRDKRVSVGAGEVRPGR